MTTLLVRLATRFARVRHANPTPAQCPRPTATFAVAATLLLTLLAPAAAAMMHPQMGRFLQRDPLGYVDGMSTYAYMRNQPSRFVDPFGTNAQGGQTTPPPPLPGDWEWNPDRRNSRGGTWIDRSQPGRSASWDWDYSHWDVDDGQGTRQRYDRRGNPLSPKDAHNPPRRMMPLDPPKKGGGAAGRAAGRLFSKAILIGGIILEVVIAEEANAGEQDLLDYWNALNDECGCWCNIRVTGRRGFSASNVYMGSAETNSECIAFEGVQRYGSRRNQSEAIVSGCYWMGGLGGLFDQ